MKNFIKTFLGLGGSVPEFRKLFLHASGKIDPEVATYLPESEYKNVILKARIYLSVFLLIIIASIIFHTILPLMYVGLPTLFGSWLMPIYGYTQHAGLQENVLDHRLNCRTVYMNLIHRFLYWNMNYHVEHHMFPLVPYHALPKLHEIIKEDCPPAYKSITDAFREIIPAVFKQMKDPAYYVERKLPQKAGRLEDQKTRKQETQAVEIQKDKLVICSVSDLPKGEVRRFDLEKKTYAVYRTTSNNYYATEGICSHGNAHLAEGIVINEMIECAKHNGRFNLKDGSPKRIPVCTGIKTFKVEVVENKLVIDLEEIRSYENVESEMTYKVVANKNVATFIKELELAPVDTVMDYLPGQYIHLAIPPHRIKFSDFDITAPYHLKWKNEKLFDFWAENAIYTKRNYSLASNPGTNDNLKFNIRIALSPNKKMHSAGAGSSYVFNLKEGDEVKLSGPHGNFLQKNTNREMVYLGGGAGMAPIRSHISHLFETLQTKRQVSFWYGARALNDLFYANYFKSLEKNNSNFLFNTALSDPDKNDNWKGNSGFIHEILYRNYLTTHPNPKEIEFYLCGPPAMIKAGLKMLKKLNIPDDMIAYDEF